MASNVRCSMSDVQCSMFDVRCAMFDGQQPTTNYFCLLPPPNPPELSACRRVKLLDMQATACYSNDKPRMSAFGRRI